MVPTLIYISDTQPSCIFLIHNPHIYFWYRPSFIFLIPTLRYISDTNSLIYISDIDPHVHIFSVEKIPEVVFEDEKTREEGDQHEEIHQLQVYWKSIKIHQN